MKKTLFFSLLLSYCSQFALAEPPKPSTQTAPEQKITVNRPKPPRYASPSPVTAKYQFKDNSWTLLYDDYHHIEFYRRYEDVITISTYRKSPKSTTLQFSMTDYYRIVRDRQTVEHILPEGGMLTYRHDSNNKIREILWTPRYGRKTYPVLNTSEQTPGYIFGNQLVFRVQTKEPAKTQLSLWNAYRKKPLWVQELDFATDGTLNSEQSSLPEKHLHSTSHYTYDTQQRLASATVNTQYLQQKSKTYHQYAWNPDGSRATTTHNSTSNIPHISRDDSDLPVILGNKTLEFDNARRLEKVTQDGKLVAEYTYNFQGQRIHKYLGGDHISFFYYENNRLIGEAKSPVKHSGSIYEKRGTIDRRYIYAGQLPVAFIEYGNADFPLNNESDFFLQPDEFKDDISPWKIPYILRVTSPLNLRRAHLFFIHSDHIGQPFMVTDENRNIRWLAQNSPTGETRILYENIEFNLRLPGQYYDRETGWHYNGRRYYDPVAGHYLEPEQTVMPSGLPPFSYAAQQPRRFINPLGLFPIFFDEAGKKIFDSPPLNAIKNLYTAGSSYYAEPRTAAERAIRTAAYIDTNPMNAPHYLPPLDNLKLPSDINYLTPENRQTDIFLGLHASISGSISNDITHAPGHSTPGMYSNFSTLPLKWVDWRRINAPKNTDPGSNDAAANAQRLANDPQSRHYYHHPDLGKQARERVEQLIGRIPANIPWLSLPLSNGNINQLP